jgi:hypothetical protein
MEQVNQRKIKIIDDVYITKLLLKLDDSDINRERPRPLSSSSATARQEEEQVVKEEEQEAVKGDCWR